jgi:CDP-diacylglycerol---glycerol-3-phosphate 3-phosphatidyltransferase
MSRSPYGIIPDQIEVWFCKKLESLSGRLFQIGLRPNHVTFISLLFGFITGCFLMFGHINFALITGIVMAICDILDGQLASLIHQNSPFGAVLDSTIDRYNESFLFMGLAIYYYFNAQPLFILITVVALIGSLLVSYVKARAEAQDIKCTVGLTQRSERLVLLMIGGIFKGWILKLVLVLLAVMTHFTVIQRVAFVRKMNGDVPRTG